MTIQKTLNNILQAADDLTAKGGAFEVTETDINGQTLPVYKEVYYWDSYFTMLGLAGSGNTLLLSDMVENFAYLIDSIGFVPNGNRTYYTSRSQPPFFSLMVDLLATTLGDEKIYCRYFSAMETEYEFWMAGIDKTMSSKDCTRAIKVDGCIFNRYWDDLDSPRPESYWEDKEE